MDNMDKEMVPVDNDIYGLFSTIWEKTSTLFKVLIVGGFCASIYWLRRYSKRKLIFTEVNLSMVGFGRVTLNNAREMIEQNVRFKEIRQQTLARDSDLQVNDLRGSQVLLVASFTERNNIMGQAPDYGELSRLYTSLPISIKRNVFVMYAGVPQSQFEGKAGSLLYPESYRKLERSQPDLSLLMESNRFIAITNKFTFNKLQFSVFEKWLSSNND